MTLPRSATIRRRAVGRRSGRRALGVTAGVIVSISLLGACGDDTTETFCETGDSLRANVAGLADVSIITDGTSGLQERVSAIRADIDELRSSGTEVASDDLDALDESVQALGTALSGLSGGVSTEDAQAVLSAATGIAGAAANVISTLASACD